MDLQPDNFRGTINVPCKRGKAKKPPRHKQGERFLKGPVPQKWLRVAVQLPGAAVKATVVVWYLAGLKKSREVRPTWRDWATFGLDRKAGDKGLQSLESVGLISVDRRSGRCPIVTIHDVEEDE